MKPRDARPGDLAELGALEVAAFATDRLSQRSMRRLLSTPTACLRVLGAPGAIAGYHLTLFRSRSRVARLYSLLVAPQNRGKGVAEVLLADAEGVARRRGALAIRLEVREDNARAIRLYERSGYRRIGQRPHYYADNANALRYEKVLPAGESAEAIAGEEDRSPESTVAGASHTSMTAIRLPAAPRVLRRAAEG